jgi:hypothetical protein
LLTQPLACVDAQHVEKRGELAVEIDTDFVMTRSAKLA